MPSQGVSRRILTTVVAAGVAGVLVWLALPPRAQPAARPRGDARVVRGAVHVHTDRSDGTGTVGEVAEAARRADLQFVVLTDHGDGTRTPDPPQYRAGVLCLDAVEISTSGGHYVALGLERAPYRLAGEPRDVVEDVRRLGGVGIVAHPDSPKTDLRWTAWDEPFDGLEWLNADSQWRDESVLAMMRALATYLFRGPETIAALFNRPDETLTRWDALNRERRVVGMAGHDAHARIGLRGNWEPADGDVSLRAPSYEAAFRTFAVRVQLHAPFGGDAATDAARLLDGIRAGRVYTAIDALATGGWLDVTATTDGRRAGAGDDLATDGTAAIHVLASPASGLSLVLLRDGTTVAAARGAELRAEHDGPSVATYRVEAFLDRAGGRAGVPWMISNAIRIGPAATLASSRRPAGAVVSATAVLDQGAEWRTEQDPASRLSFDAREAPWGGTAHLLSYDLADGAPRGQYGAAVLGVPRGSLHGWDRLSFRTRADGPMRLSVQLRDPATGHRWARSVYVPPHTEEVAVAFAEMTAVDGGTRAADLEQVDSVLFVVDTTNTAPGSRGAVWIGDVLVQRVEPDQVRTVSSR